MFRHYSQWVITYPKSILITSLITVFLFGYLASDIKLDNNFAVLFSNNSEASKYREFYRDSFGPDDALLVAILDAKSVPPTKMEPLIESLSNLLEKNKDYHRITSITKTSVIWSDSNTVYIEPAMGSSTSRDTDLKLRLHQTWESALGGNRLLSEDARYFVITAEMQAELDTHEKVIGPAKDFQATVNQAVTDSGLDISAYFAGVAFTRVSAIGQMQGDLLLLSPITTIVIALLLYFLFRDWRIVFATQLSIGFSVIITAGIIRLFNDNINQLTVVFPILLMLVVTANALHILHRYFKELEQTNELTTAVQNTITSTVKACWISCVTTAIGFASLIFADMFILNSFGVYLALGVLSSFFILTGFLPSLLIIAKIQPRSGAREGFISNNAVHKIAQTISQFVSVKRNARLLNFISLTAFVVLALVLKNINYDYSLSDMLSKNDPVNIGNKIVDNKLTGIMPVEVSFLSSEPNRFKDPEALLLIDQLSQWLINNYQVDPPISLASIIKELNAGFSGDEKIPSSEAAIAQLLMLAESAPDQAVQQLVTDDYSHTRLRAATKDGGADYFVALKNAFDQQVKTLALPADITITMTGEIPVAYDGMNRLSEELFQSVLIALAVITVVIFVVFRDIKLTLASLIPNILPIAIGLFIYRLYTDILDPLPGIAFCIAIGIAVDDTVHLIFKYNEMKSHPNPQRLQLTLSGILHPLLNSTVILTLGFLVLLFSSFSWNQMMGFLGASMIVSAFICDIVLTPAVLMYFTSQKNDVSILQQPTTSEPSSSEA